MPEPARTLLIPNVAAEEGAVWRAAGGEATVRAVVHLWRLIFGADTELLDARDDGRPRAWPEALGAEPGAPVFPELDAPDAAAAWLNTREAERLAAARGRVLLGAPPAVVEQVHDKAFAHAVAEREGLLPLELEACIEVFDASDLRDADAAVRRIDARLARWPAWTRGNFVLKPRLGSSGRGRVPGRSARADTAEVRGALARLQERGGAILEPWLERRSDFSAQLWVDLDGGLRLLGTLELLTTPAGVYRGHRGWLDGKGRITSGLDCDEALREAAAAVAGAARDAGYRGPCGVDGFSFTGERGREALRPALELNARFTLGTIAAGLVRRALRPIKRTLRTGGAERRPFLFGLDAPPGGWPPSEPGARVLLPLWREDELRRPALLVAANAGELERALGNPAVGVGSIAPVDPTRR
jgi:hypothetical protein